MAKPKSTKTPPREQAPVKDERPTAPPVQRRLPMPYDSLPDSSFDRTARLAAGALHSPIAIVSILDADRHVVKSSIGLTARSRAWRKVPLALGYAREAVTTMRTVVVSEFNDLTAREGVATAQKSPDGVAYAVAPLIGTDGVVTGTICAVNPTPHAWTNDEIGSLNDLAELLVTEMELTSDLFVKRATQEHLL